MNTIIYTAPPSSFMQSYIQGYTHIGILPQLTDPAEEPPHYVATSFSQV